MLPSLFDSYGKLIPEVEDGMAQFEIMLSLEIDKPDDV
ncbi:hypothetical protein A3Q56_03633 [Intoshia linei]|uniref:Uncharacterized protein n=1 Tax=Intoshia linei TaxID=1819745 RepID=A0A177B2V9_9BILA|nr:hypothetical protein A3Q56_03633 [Intoshia linei]